MLASVGENAAFSNCGVRSKKFDQISPKIWRAGETPPTPPPARRSDPFGPACRQAGWTISSFSLAVNSFNSEIWDSNPAFFINVFCNSRIQIYIYY